MIQRINTDATSYLYMFQKLPIIELRYISLKYYVLTSNDDAMIAIVLPSETRKSNAEKFYFSALLVFLKFYICTMTLSVFVSFTRKLRATEYVILTKFGIFV